MESSSPLYPPRDDRSGTSHTSRKQVVALAGGVGGAKMAWGLAQNLNADELSIIGNVGDDFEHLGLHISPDLDTVMYTLAGIVNPDTGWGVNDETWSMMRMLNRYAAPTWFQLGDQDTATHLLRTHWLRQGFPLTWVTGELSKLLGVRHRLLPACDDPFQTVIHSSEGVLSFQEWFVARRWQPVVQQIEFKGIESARATTDVVNALRDADVVILCPSNPYVSLDPILALPAVRRILAASTAFRVAVSPIVGGRAIKGPAAKMMHEMGLEPSPLTVAHHFKDVLDAFVLDEVDAEWREQISQETGLIAHVTNTVMQTLDDRRQLAAEVLNMVTESS